MIVLRHLNQSLRLWPINVIIVREKLINLGVLNNSQDQLSRDYFR